MTSFKAELEKVLDKEMDKPEGTGDFLADEVQPTEEQQVRIADMKKRYPKSYEYKIVPTKDGTPRLQETWDKSEDAISEEELQEEGEPTDDGSNALESKDEESSAIAPEDKREFAKLLKSILK